MCVAGGVQCLTRTGVNLRDDVNCVSQYSLVIPLCGNYLPETHHSKLLKCAFVGALLLFFNWSRSV